MLFPPLSFLLFLPCGDHAGELLSCACLSLSWPVAVCFSCPDGGSRKEGQPDFLPSPVGTSRMKSLPRNDSPSAFGVSQLRCAVASFCCACLSLSRPVAVCSSWSDGVFWKEGRPGFLTSPVEASGMESLLRGGSPSASGVFWLCCTLADSFRACSSLLWPVAVRIRQSHGVF